MNSFTNGRWWVGLVLMISLLMNVAIELNIRYEVNPNNEISIDFLAFMIFWINFPTTIGILTFVIDKINQYTGKLKNGQLKKYIHYSGSGENNYVVYFMFITSAITLNIFHLMILSSEDIGKGLIFAVIPIHSSIIGIIFGGVISFIWYIYKKHTNAS